MIVADASAIVEVLTSGAGNRRAEQLVERFSRANGVHVPHLVDTEVQAAIRGLVLGFKLPVPRAVEALDDYEALPLLRYPAEPLARAIWDLRNTLTTHDATYVALAAALGCPLLTCDRTIARAVPEIAEVF